MKYLKLAKQHAIGSFVERIISLQDILIACCLANFKYFIIFLNMHNYKNLWKNQSHENL